MTYDELISKKVKKPLAHGFEPVRPINANLFPWQKLIVEWAIRQGRCALFEDCGLGKTLQQLEWAWQVAEYTKGSVLILCPLAVAAQTVAEAEKFGFPKVHHIHHPDELTGSGVFITNYERLELFKHVIPNVSGVVLDESSILKSFMGKTRIALTSAFSQTPYRLSCTATPAPNDYIEFGQQAEFLGVTTYQVMLSTYFINDTANTGDWRLKRHARGEFWKWVSTWAACVSKPSDIGFADEGFELPPLKIHSHIVAVDQTHGRGDELFRNASLSATNIHREMRVTCPARVAKCAELVNSSAESWVVWCNTNQEADELKAAIPDAIEVRGNDKPEHKESKLGKFTRGEARVIITKPSIAGYGLNWQHCGNHAFVGLSYSFEDFYQAMRRGYRFGRFGDFNCHIIQADTETSVAAVVRQKMQQHEEMRNEMKLAADSLRNESDKSLVVNESIHYEESPGAWRVHNGDCVRVARSMHDNSVGFSVFSPPFADLFVYSNAVEDMGNCASLADFMEQFNFLVDELMRVTQPGRLCAVHCSDLLATKWKDGEIELKNFSGELCESFRERGWLYHCRVTIWKDPVVEMQRTKSLGLLHKQLLKDSAMSRVGSPEYVLVFRKPGVNANPISHNRENYPVELWQRDASPVWMDVNQTRVLNGAVARDNSDEKHICPLQLDVIERLLRLYTNPGDLVFSPFTGIGSEGYCSVKAGRKFIGAELKESYFKLACRHLKQAEEESRTLFKLA